MSTPGIPLRSQDSRRAGGSMPESGAGAPGGLARLGTACARRPWLVISIWLAVLALTGAGRQLFGGTFSDNVDLPNTQSSTGAALLSAHQPAAAGSSGLVVFHVGSGSLSADRTQIESGVTALRGLPHVLSASDPFSGTSPTVSADGRTAYSTVQFEVRPKTLGAGYLSQLDGAVAAAR